MKLALNIARDIICVAAILLVIVAGICFALQIKPVVVISGSMEPTIKTGSIAFIDQKDTTDIHKNDIIAFTRQGELITHRVTSVSGNEIHTQGDNNNVEDMSVITRENVIGKTIFWVPKVGYAAKWISSKSGMIAMLTICIVIILASFLLPEDEEKSSEKPKKSKGKSSKKPKTKKKKTPDSGGKEDTSMYAPPAVTEQTETPAESIEEPMAEETVIVAEEPKPVVVERTESPTVEAENTADKEEPIETKTKTPVEEPVESKPAEKVESAKVTSGGKAKRYLPDGTPIPRNREEFDSMSREDQQKIIKLARELKEKKIKNLPNKQM